MDGISKTTSDKSKKTNSDTRKDIMEFHKKIEHHNIKITKTTVYIYNITLVGGDLDKWKSYVLGKEHQKNTRKDTDNKLKTIICCFQNQILLLEIIIGC